MISSLYTRSILLFSIVSAFQPSRLSIIHKTSSRSSIATNLKMTNPTHHFPELIVFDLDACFWDQEMYTLSQIPNESNIVKGDLHGRGEGVVGVMSGSKKISLHKGSLIALQNHYDGKYPNTKVCFASSADTPLAEQIGRAALKLLEVVPVSL